MYGMVLLAALTTGADLPDCGRGGGWGYGGGYGGYYGYGRGYGYGGGYGWGGPGWGGYGWGGYGLGGYGLGGYGYGGYVQATPMSSYNWGSYVVPSYGIASMPLSTSTSTRSMYYNPSSVSDSNRATIRVHLPADAILYVDGKITSSSSDMRQFISPPLDADKDYHYTMKATVNRNGETLTRTRRVDVRAGRTDEVYLNFPGSDRTNEGDRAPADSTPKRNNPDQP